MLMKFTVLLLSLAAFAANAWAGESPAKVAVSDRLLQVGCLDVTKSQWKAFAPGDFPHLIETRGPQKSTVPSSKTCALFVRETEGSAEEK